MASISFWARGDRSAANNPSLNVENTNTQPTVSITFTNDIPDGTPDQDGDLSLDYNGGLADPDTTLVIAGIEYEFTFEVIGTLPVNKKVPDPLQGKEIAVISYIDGAGDYQRLFFVIDGSGTFALMEDFGPGAIKLSPVDTSPPDTPVCFCAGTEILTPSGNRKVETLAAGDFVLNVRGERKQIIWAGCTRVSAHDLVAGPNLRPVRIPADAFGPGRPSRDLDVSPQHRIVLEGPAVEMHFGCSSVLAAAKHLIGTFAEEIIPEADVDYYHILLEDHEILVSNGLATESFQPARRTIEAMSGANRELLERTIEALGAADMLNRKDVLPSLKRGESVLLAAMLAHGGEAGAAVPLVAEPAMGARPSA